MTVPQEVLAERVARSLGQRLLAWRPVTRGYTTASRLIVTCADGSSVFVKGATDTRTAKWLRTEYGVYSQVQASFLPAMRAWADDGSDPFLVLEDLTGAAWQAPWPMARISQVLDTLRQVAATRAPTGLSSLEERRSSLRGWSASPSYSCGCACARPPGWVTASRPSWRQKPPQSWLVTAWCTVMSEATISALSAIESCSSIGTGPVAVTASSMLQDGCRASTWKADPCQRLFSRSNPTWRPSSVATLRPVQGFLWSKLHH